jgi:hypothetical protein
MDLLEANRSVHQHGDQGCGLDGGIPAIDVVTRIRFGDSEFLRLFQRFIEGEAFFHLTEDYVGRRVQDSVEALQVDGGQLVEEREDGDPIHHGGLEEEALASARGQIAEFAIGVDDGAFVGSNRVGSMVQGGADVVDGRLSGRNVEGSGFEEDVSFGRGEPGMDVCSLREFRGGGRFDLFGIDACRIGDPTEAAGGDSCDDEFDPATLAEFLRSISEEADQGAVYVAEAQEAEIVGADRASHGAKARMYFCLNAALKRWCFYNRSWLEAVLK